MEILIFSVLFISCVICFNIDTDNVVNFKGLDGIHFGYSAAMLSNPDGQKWVVVGATKANFSDDQKIKTPGNIYRCRLNFTRQLQAPCEPINPRQSGIFKFPGSPGYEEDQELLGASMSLIDDKLVTCAPLWKNWIPWKKSNLTHPTGRCFNIDRTLTTYNTQVFPKNKFLAFIPESENQFTYQFAQIGFSVSTKKFEDPLLDVLIGAPGFFQDKGGFIQYSATDTSDNFFDSFTHQAFEPDQAESIKMGTLMGYSITTGKLVDSSCPGVIVLGAPHFLSTDGIVGAVLVVCAEAGALGKEMEIKKQFFGRKTGCGFGTSVVFDDFNGDDLDDLLVGAPLQYDTKTNVLDVGAVYIFYGDSDSTVLLERSSQVLTGSNAQNGRFGTAMQSVGDLNKDNLNDIVVAAPYEDDLKGAIYIYHGGSSELMLTQRISGKTIGTDLHSFGWYISAAYDIDNNQYPDFLVGSYMSDTVSLLRTRPIIKLYHNLLVNPTLIPLNSSGLQCQDDMFRPCVTINMCFSYSGLNVPDKIMVAYNISADILRTRAIPSKSSRVHFDSEGVKQDDFLAGKTVVTNGQNKCVIFSAIVQAVNREFFASLEEELILESKFGLSEESIPGEVQPILDNKPTVKTVSANFSTGCNGTCHPDLNIEASLQSDDVILGDTSEIVVNIKVTNIGDQSHGTQVLIDISNNTQYLGYFQPQNEVTELVVCQNVMDASNDSRVQCDLKRALFQQQKALVSVRFLVSRSLLLEGDSTLDNFDQRIILKTGVQSTSPDRDMLDNMQTVIATVKLHSRVELSGISKPEQLQVSEKADKVLRFTHTYSVVNRGPSPLSDGKLYICLPVMSDTGKGMMEKTDIKVTENSPELTWQIIRFPGETNYIIDEGKSTSTTPEQTSTTMSPSTTLPERQSIAPNRRKRQTSEQLVQHHKTNELKSRRNFKEISCNTADQSKNAIVQFDVKLLEKLRELSFDIAVDISENSLSFQKVSGIVYKSTGEVDKRINNRYITTAVNTTYDVPSEIFPNEISVEAEKINIWIIIGACIGGLVLLILIGVILWKCGFFQRKRKQDVQKWKRQSGYYAKRQSARAGSTKSSKIQNTDWQN